MGASLAFLAFAVATVSGVMVGNPVKLIVGRAVVALFAFYALGRILGWLAERILAEREEALSRELEEEIAASHSPVEEGAEIGPMATPAESAGPQPGAQAGAAAGAATEG